MKTVRIINGTYGHRPINSKYVVPITAGDPPIALSDEKADDLVARHIAEFVATNQMPKTTDEGENNDGDGKKPAYNVLMKVVELKEIMDTYGITIPANATKKEMIALLDDYFRSIGNQATTDESENDGGSAPPVLIPEDVV